MRRLDSLDGVRGLLALYVLLSHVAPFAVLPDGLQRVLSHGGAAVDVFFVLSGLVITQSLLHAGGHAVPFLVARIARIFPVFLVVFVVAVMVEPLSCGFERMPWIGLDAEARTICVGTWPRAWVAEIAAHLTMTHGLFPRLVLPDVWVSFLGSAWSLSTEWQFYVLAMLAAGRTRQLVWILLGLGVAGLAWRWSMPEPWQFSRAFLPNKGHFFALGVASVAVVRGERGAVVRYLLVLAAALAICSTDASIGKLLPALAWTVCLAVERKPDTVGLRAVGALLRSRTARYLGAISYCLYLVNEPIHKVVGLVTSRLADGDGALFNAVWLPAAIGLPLLAAAALHVYLEAPALRRGRDIVRRLSQNRGAVTVQVRNPAL